MLILFERSTNHLVLINKCTYRLKHTISPQIALSSLQNNWGMKMLFHPRRWYARRRSITREFSLDAAEGVEEGQGDGGEVGLGLRPSHLQEVTRGHLSYHCARPCIFLFFFILIHGNKERKLFLKVVGCNDMVQPTFFLYTPPRIMTRFQDVA